MPTATPKAKPVHKSPVLQQHENRRFYWKGYRTGRWKRARKKYLEANPLCVYCLEKGRTTPAVVVDHTIPIEDGSDPWDESNWQGLCIRDDASKRGKTKRPGGRG